jgi:peroxiredoxin
MGIHGFAFSSFLLWKVIKLKTFGENYYAAKMKSVLKSFLWIIVLVVLYFSGILNYASSLAQGAVLLSGLMDAAPDDSGGKEVFDFKFTLKDTSGKKVEFSEYKGKVVFLNLWATRCPPCRSEMPAIQKLYDDMDKDKVSFVMLSLDKDAYVEKVKRFVAKNSFSFPVFMPSGYLTEQLQVPSIPTTFVLNKDGTIAFKEVGMKNYNTPKFKKFLNELAQ